MDVAKEEVNVPKWTTTRGKASHVPNPSLSDIRRIGADLFPPSDYVPSPVKQYKESGIDKNWSGKQNKKAGASRKAALDDDTQISIGGIDDNMASAVRPDFSESRGKKKDLGAVKIPKGATRDQSRHNEVC